MNIEQKNADAQRNEAKKLMLRLLGIGQGESNGMVEKIVDCIIKAAALEAVIAINHEIQGKSYENKG